MTNSQLPRRFALLGGPHTTHALEAAIRHSDSHQFVAAFEADIPDLSHHQSWESLLSSGEWESAIFSWRTEEILEAARQLVLHGKTVIFEAQTLLPSEFVAEMSLLDAEGAAQIVPFFNWQAFPAVRLMQKIVEAGELGPLLEITIDRCWNGPRGEEPGIPRDAAEGITLLMDIDIARTLGGDYSQVTVLRSGVSETGFLQQTLQLAGPDLPPATCTYRSGDEFDWLCRVVGTEGTATMKLGQGCQLDVDGTARTPTDSREANAALLSLQLLDESLRGDPRSPRWRDLVRFYEIKAAMDRSLRRRRTIDLHFETTSERSQFKTHMATIGCGVLTYTLFGVIGLLFAGAVLDPRDRMQREAQAAGFVVGAESFEPDSGRLTEAGAWQLADIARRMSLSEGVVIVAAGDTEDSSAGDAERLQTVRQTLAEGGAEEADSRAVLRSLKGTWFLSVMQITRMLVFAPVGLYLLIQLLLSVAKPPAAQKDSL